MDMEKQVNYKPRIADRLLARKLEGMGAVLIEGPKWCGKTTTAEQQARSILYMDDPREKMQNIQAADINPELLLAGDTPRLIDEWQIAPQLWDAIRFSVDHRHLDGQFILTGSAVPPIVEDSAVVSHTGTGRVVRLRMRPMSLWESGDSNGSVSLGALFQGPASLMGVDHHDINDLAWMVCRGGWPRATLQRADIALERAYDYYDAVVNIDISRVDSTARNPERVKRLMRSYARYQGAQAPLSSINADMKANDHSSLDERTVASYIEALKKIFVIEDMPAWNPNLRSKTAIRTSDTRYFIDPSIAVAALGLGPNDLLADLNTFGLLFETMCGIRIDGENHFLLSPKPGGSFTYAGASYDSIYGTVACRWERSDAGVRYTAEIPPNTSARVELPGMEPFEVKAGKYEWMAETEKMTQKK